MTSCILQGIGFGDVEVLGFRGRRLTFRRPLSVYMAAFVIILSPVHESC